MALCKWFCLPNLEGPTRNARKLIFRKAFQELEPRPSENNTLPDQSIDLIEPGDPNDEHPIEPIHQQMQYQRPNQKKDRPHFKFHRGQGGSKCHWIRKTWCPHVLRAQAWLTLRLAAGLTPVLQQHAVETVEDNDEDNDIEGNDENPDFDLHSEYPESDSSDEEDEEFQLRTDITPEEERQFLVSEVQLARLLQNCSVCNSACHTVVNGVCGTMISTSSVCPNGHSST